MPTLEQVERQVKQLSRAEQQALRDWLENVLEDELTMTDQFKAKIAQGEKDLLEGRVRASQA